MSEQIVINPSWFVSQKCKSITEKYFLKLSHSQQSKLKEKLSSLDSKEDYVEFLAGDGEIIWDEFIKDIARSKVDRNFSPFSDAEAEVLYEKINGHFKEFGAEADSDTNKKRIKLNPLVVRLLIAIILLCGGFFVIYFTFVSLPGLSQQYQEQVEENLKKHNVEASLEEVKQLMSGNESKQILSQLNGLKATFDKTESALDSFVTTTSEIGNIKDQQQKALKDIHDQRVKLDGAIDGFIKTKDQFNINSAPLTKELSEVMKKIDGWIEPVKIQAAWDEVEKKLNEYGRTQSELLSGFARSWDVDGERWKPTKSNYWGDKYGTAYINFDEYEKINAIMEWSKNSTSIYRPVEFVEFQKSLTSLQQNTKLVPIEDAFKQDIIKLNSQLSLIATGYQKIKDEMAGMIQVSNSIENAHKQLSANEEFANIGKSADSLLTSIEHASNIVRGNQSTLERRQDTLKKMEAAIDNLGGLARVQADLAFKGASPTVFLLLAIGGMFVTFGLSSLLKWAKDIDEKKENEIWARRTHLYTAISASLIQHGVDPSLILSRLQNAFPTAGSELSGVKFPITETISEIGKMIKK